MKLNVALCCWLDSSAHRCVSGPVTHLFTVHSPWFWSLQGPPGPSGLKGEGGDPGPQVSVKPPRLLFEPSLQILNASCVCSGAPWHPGASGTNGQIRQTGEWTLWPLTLSEGLAPPECLLCFYYSAERIIFTSTYSWSSPRISVRAL